MHNKSKIIAFVALVFCTVNPSRAQGTLEATLSPYFPSAPPLSGSVVVHTPETNSVATFFPISFEIRVNGTEPVFDTGRISGGNTAWAFPLAAPVFSDGSMFYTGTTSMGAFSINDMLSNRTQFELVAYAGDGTWIGGLVGPLTAVPEPSSAFLLIAGLALLGVLRKSASTSPAKCRVPMVKQS
jgi:hypothetical protein